MSDHAGFAAAVTIRESALNISIAAAYANGDFSPNLSGNLLGDGPEVSLSLFLGQPRISCEGASNVLVIQIETWGTTRINMSGFLRIISIISELELAIRPVFTPGESLQLTPGLDGVILRQWNPVIVSTNLPPFPDYRAYINGAEFKDRLQNAIGLAIVLGQIKLPKIDVSFFGPIAEKATSVDARIRNNALLLGLNVVDETHTITGDISELEDFARGYDLAAVVNSHAIELFLNDLYEQMKVQAVSRGATISNFSAITKPGYMLVSGRASKTEGAIDFSFRVVPYMYHTRPGKYFNYLPKPRWVNSRTYAALGFRAEGVTVSSDRPWWVLLFFEVIGGIITGGASFLIIESLIRYASSQFISNVDGRSLPDPPARIVRTKPTTDSGIGVRVALEAFEINNHGTFLGISFRDYPSLARIHGPKVIPHDYANNQLQYRFQIPSSFFEADPALRITWTLQNRSNGIVLSNEDTSALGHLKFVLLPNVHSGVREFEIAVRLYRRNGARITEISNVFLYVNIRESLQPDAYIKWRSYVKNPQIGFDPPNNTWVYKGESNVVRWSEWHRLDRPCKAVGAANRYRTDFQLADRLPFSLDKLEIMRGGLCPYCFYGSPTGINPEF